MATSPLNRWIVLEEINPEPWAIGNAFAKRQGGQIKGGMSPNQKLAVYQHAVRDELRAMDFEMVGADIPLSLNFLFVRQVDAWTSPNGRAGQGNSADVTNLQKATEDALQGILLANDRQVLDVHSQLVEQGVDKTPFVGVYLQQIAPIDPGFVNTLRTQQAQAQDDHLW